MTLPRPSRVGARLGAAVAGVLLASLAGLSVTGPAQATVGSVAAQAAFEQWTGWAQIPGGGQTPDAPVAVTFAGNQNVFVRGNDNAIYRNTFSNATGLWSGWSQVPGGGATPSALAAVTHAGALHLFARGTDNAIYRNVLVP